ncbi:hypothetical protein [Aneurinibacillus migulanus]|uniref:Uncharacterized protein n=2 Tax=Aneurinibacillus migulanus TaxID=47500 RepID=A0A1G8LQ16_ANEMI|nr:hypothetical protein [Aneurinibacillus migulanus]MCP1355030.1 hypothetical protein [Aneurinibacillus migulanus]MED0893298.1 hypothetical protein [Aneurinibacillus migulanus]MED1615397.1 hypothetical protein [Aneurinibacillus migulanus]MED4727622.1 hypothetical protein [Aneurinibacillus migulanus]SDI57801.1 hypothetical protein SAMN04487909_105169 [Aneurinibacillus migulanus]
MMKVTLRDVLESRGVQVSESHLDVLEQRWQAIQYLKADFESAVLDDYDIALRHIPGGDHIE